MVVGQWQCQMLEYVYPVRPNQLCSEHIHASWSGTGDTYREPCGLDECQIGLSSEPTLTDPFEYLGAVTIQLI